MSLEQRQPVILIVEDGDEYLDNLGRFVSGPRWLQAHHADAALELLRATRVDLLYLDMRFDRIPREDLVGDHDAAARDCNGDAARAWRFLQNNQGLYVLAHLADNGFGSLPAVIAYDFSREPARWKHLAVTYPRLAWVPDAVTPAQITAVIEGLLG